VQFTGAPVYLDGQAPSADEIAARIDTYWRPYHAALQDELARIHATHGRVLLWEGHSIRGSDLEFLFPGRLPDLNLGTSGGATCARERQARVEDALAKQSRYDFVVNGRFKGGYITRHYADPARGIDAIQLEISQRIYMDEETFDYEPDKAAGAQAAIRSLLEAALA
jgi:N-formylglutamate deformylase